MVGVWGSRESLEVNGKVVRGSGALLGDHLRLQGSLEEQCGCPGFNGRDLWDQWGGFWGAQGSSARLPGGLGLTDRTVWAAGAHWCGCPGVRGWLPEGIPAFPEVGPPPRPPGPPASLTPSSPRGRPWAPPPVAVTMAMVTVVTAAPVGPPPFPGEAWRRGGTDGPGRSLPTSGERRNAATAAAHLRRAAGLAAAPRRHAGD